MILSDIFSYNRQKYFSLIVVLVALNVLLHPLTAGYLPRAADGAPDYGAAWATNFLTWGITWNVFAMLIGTGVGAFGNSSVPLRIRTAKAMVKTIFWMQLIFAAIHMTFFISQSMHRLT